MKRFSLFTFDATALAFSRKLLREAKDSFNPSAELAVFALLKPLFEPELFEALMRDTPGSKPLRCSRISRIAALLSRNDLSAAVKLARETWNACGVRLIEVPIAYDSTNDADICQRLLGAMLIPVRPNDVLSIFRRWRSSKARLPSNATPRRAPAATRFVRKSQCADVPCAALLIGSANRFRFTIPIFRMPPINQTRFF